MKKLTFESPAKALEAATLCKQLGTNSNLQIEVNDRSILFIGTQPSEMLITLLRHRWGFEFADEDTQLFMENNSLNRPSASKAAINQSKSVRKGCLVIAGSLLIVISVLGFLAMIVSIGLFPYPFFSAMIYLAFLIGGLLLVGFRFGKLVGKKQNINTELTNSNSTVERIRGQNSAVGVIDREKYFKLEYNEEQESRMYNSDPSFSSVLTPYNNRQYREAIENGEKLLIKFSDFDILYSWLGSAYKELSLFEQSKAILLDGLNKSKRKCLLLIDLGEISLKLNSLDDAVYYLSQALCCTIKSEEYKIFLLMHYIAKGMGLDNEALSFLRQVDNLRAGQIRLNAGAANQVMTVARNKINPLNKQIVIELNKKYLNN